MPLLALSNELLLQIVGGDNPLDADINNIFRTCRRLKDIATIIIRSRLRYYFPEEPFAPLLKDPYVYFKRRLDLHPERAHLVKSVFFVCPLPRSQPDIWDAMVVILRRLYNLQEVRIRLGKGIIRLEPGIVVPGSIISADGRPTRNVAIETPSFDEQRNLFQLLKIRGLNSVHTVVLEHKETTVDELLAFFALPKIRSLQVTGFKGKILSSDQVPFQSSLKKFVVSSDIAPTGCATEQLFKGLLNLNELSWTVEPYVPRMLYPRSRWTPHDIEKALIPCLSSLKSLEIIIKIRCHRTEKPVFDFTNFTSLTKLKISSDIIFPWENEYGTRNKRLDFGNYLPRSLESLVILFDDLHDALLPVDGGVDENYWFLSPAHLKSRLFPRLVVFNVVEEVYWGFHVQALWPCPSNVRATFEMAGIDFTMVLRRLHDKGSEP